LKIKVEASELDQVCTATLDGFLRAALSISLVQCRRSLRRWTATSRPTGLIARPRLPKRRTRRARTQRSVDFEAGACVSPSIAWLTVRVLATGFHLGLVQAGREAGSQKRRKGPDQAPCPRRRPHLQRYSRTGRQERRGRCATSHRRRHGTLGSTLPCERIIAPGPAAHLVSVTLSAGRQDHFDPLPRAEVYQEHDGGHQGAGHDRFR
jgi:hypothetical protein